MQYWFYTLKYASLDSLSAPGPEPLFATEQITANRSFQWLVSSCQLHSDLTALETCPPLTQLPCGLHLPLPHNSRVIHPDHPLILGSGEPRSHRLHQAMLVIDTQQLPGLPIPTCPSSPRTMLLSSLTSHIRPLTRAMSQHRAMLDRPAPS